MYKFALICALGLAACGGGTQLPPSELPNVKTWTNTVVQGTVASKLLRCTSKQDTEETFFNNTITGDWGTLAGLDGSTSLPNVTGNGTPYWQVENGLFHFSSVWHPQAEGFAILSKELFSHTEPISVEAPFHIKEGGFGAFAGLTIIAGEGDYREIAFRKNGNGFNINRVAPCEETTLVSNANLDAVLRIEYIPSFGWNYYVDGILVGTEEITVPSVSLSSKAHIGLYFTSIGLNTFVRGTVGEIRFDGTPYQD